VALGLLVAAGAAGWVALPPAWKKLALNAPRDTNVLFWSVAQRDAAFPLIDRIPLLARAVPISNGPQVRPLPASPQLAAGTPLVPEDDLAAFLDSQRVAGLVVLVDGQLRLERYGLGFGPDGRWTSFSVAKSVTSTLVGAALADGAIRSLDDPVSTYITDLKGSAYDGVSVRQLLTMTSGVRWNEDYGDPNSDVARFNTHVPPPGMDATVSYMRTLPREAEPGTRWVYKTGETNLIGVLVREATGEPLAQYLARKIWGPAGMEAPATWILGASGAEISGCCLQASTRDFARFGQFILEGGRTLSGEAVLPEGWLELATTTQAGIGEPGWGYGFQWWTRDDGSYQAQGFFGQAIVIDPARRLVVAINGNWPRATGEEFSAAREAFLTSIRAAVDAERAPPAPPP
jgi:CubicO group peptidase (beta-lactamase class C family)